MNIFFSFSYANFSSELGQISKLAIFKLLELYKKNGGKVLFYICTQKVNMFKKLQSVFVKNYFFDRRKGPNKENHTMHKYSPFIRKSVQKSRKLSFSREIMLCEFCCIFVISAKKKESKMKP